MITRPSTSRALEDVVEELTRDIMPAITDPAQQIRLHMLMIVLNDCVNASEREISVMRTEIPTYLAFADDVAKATGNAEVAAAVAGAQMGDSLVLSDVIRDYENASRAFSTAMDLVMDTVNHEFIERGEALLDDQAIGIEDRARSHGQASQSRLMASPRGLTRRNDREHEHGPNDDGAERHRHAIAPEGAPQALEPALLGHKDRLAAHVTPQVIGELRSGLVAIGGVMRRGAPDDALELGAPQARQAWQVHHHRLACYLQLLRDART